MMAIDDASEKNGKYTKVHNESTGCPVILTELNNSITSKPLTATAQTMSMTEFCLLH